MAGDFTAAVLPAVLGETDAGLAASGLTALLEMTNLRRTGGVLTFASFGLLTRWLRDALGTVILRFDINNQTNKPCAGSETMNTAPQKSGF
jgi:hypothetical protein